MELQQLSYPAMLQEEGPLRMVSNAFISKFISFIYLRTQHKLYKLPSTRK